MMRLKDKVAIVTGGSSGIGQAAALLFAKEGAKVVVADIAKVDETVGQIREAGGEATFVQIDVSKVADVKKMIKTALDSYHKLDILFNNAGGEGPIVPAAELAEEDWDRVIAVNLKGVFLGCKYAIPEMVKGGGGVIISTSSIGGLRADPNLSAYCAAKAGVILLSEVVAIEYGAMNIRINCICPGPIVTPLMHRIAPAIGTQDQLAKHTALGRCGTPEEAARVALYLASDESSYITGTTVVVDGGRSARLH
jgi:NAD(P)-dependent dehydrogenase (short-subunit alcohol dehydrogenase family)